MADEMLVHAEGKALIADTAYDSDRTLANARKLGMLPVQGEASIGAGLALGHGCVEGSFGRLGSRLNQAVATAPGDQIGSLRPRLGLIMFAYVA